MRAITKGAEPSALHAYRAVPGSTYDGANFTTVKNKIRKALLRDQSHLCCYCMRRIADDARPNAAQPDAPPVVQMKVEHWRPQSRHPDLALSWPNMLGACTGNMGAPASDQTCDTRKGEEEITLNPLDPAHVATLRCTSAGRLESTNPRFQEDIDARLGLNTKILVDDRRVALERALAQLRARYPKSAIPKREVRQRILDAETAQDEKLPAMCAVLRLWARKRYGGEW